MDKDGDKKEEPMKEAAKGKAQEFKDKKTEEVKSRMKNNGWKRSHALTKPGAPNPAIIAPVPIDQVRWQGW